uniref:Tyrosine-protein phosphatase domain-containing protein n=1 Tax=Caenorhabditis tropicalis TaxID=1561998 RepID=A0A1I7TBU3_9PELO
MVNYEGAYRNLTLKSAIIEHNMLWRDLFKAIQARAMKVIREKQEEEEEDLATYNLNPVAITPMEQLPDGLTNATLIKVPKTRQSYIIMGRMTDKDAFIYWQMILEHTPPAIIMFNDNNSENLAHIPSKTNQRLCYGDLHVVLEDEVLTPSFIRCDLIIERGQDKHSVPYFQFRHWTQFEPRPDEFIGFHNFLIDNKHLKARPTRKALCCPVIMSPPGLGRAGIFVVSDIYIKMLRKNVWTDYCVERLIVKLCSNRYDAIQSVADFHMIYRHLYRFLEAKGMNIYLGNDMFDYAEGSSRLPNNAKTLNRLMTWDAWAPWSIQLHWFHWKRDAERKIQNEELNQLKLDCMLERPEIEVFDPHETG